MAPTETVRLLLSSGLEELYSASVGETLYMNWRNRAQVRAYLTKFPFNSFSGYQSIQYYATYLTGFDDFMRLCEENLWSGSDDMKP